MSEILIICVDPYGKKIGEYLQHRFEGVQNIEIVMLKKDRPKVISFDIVFFIYDITVAASKRKANILSQNYCKTAFLRIGVNSQFRSKVDKAQHNFDCIINFGTNTFIDKGIATAKLKTFRLIEFIQRLTSEADNLLKFKNSIEQSEHAVYLNDSQNIDHDKVIYKLCSSYFSKPFFREHKLSNLFSIVYQVGSSFELDKDQYELISNTIKSYLNEEVYLVYNNEVNESFDETIKLNTIVPI